MPDSKKKSKVPFVVATALIISVLATFSYCGAKRNRLFIAKKPNAPVANKSAQADIPQEKSIPSEKRPEASKKEEPLVELPGGDVGYASDANVGAFDASTSFGSDSSEQTSIGSSGENLSPSENLTSSENIASSKNFASSDTNSFENAVLSDADQASTSAPSDDSLPSIKDDESAASNFGFDDLSSEISFDENDDVETTLRFDQADNSETKPSASASNGSSNADNLSSNAKTPDASVSVLPSDDDDKTSIDDGGGLYASTTTISQDAQDDELKTVDLSSDGLYDLSSSTVDNSATDDNLLSNDANPTTTDNLNDLTTDSLLVDDSDAKTSDAPSTNADALSSDLASNNLTDDLTDADNLTTDSLLLDDSDAKTTADDSTKTDALSSNLASNNLTDDLTDADNLTTDSLLVDDSDAKSTADDSTKTDALSSDLASNDLTDADNLTTDSLLLDDSDAKTTADASTSADVLSSDLASNNLSNDLTNVGDLTTDNLLLDDSDAKTSDDASTSADALSSDIAANDSLKNGDSTSTEQESAFSSFPESDARTVLLEGATADSNAKKDASTSLVDRSSLNVGEQPGDLALDAPPRQTTGTGVESTIETLPDGLGVVSDKSSSSNASLSASQERTPGVQNDSIQSLLDAYSFDSSLFELRENESTSYYLERWNALDQAWRKYLEPLSDETRLEAIKRYQKETDATSRAIAKRLAFANDLDASRRDGFFRLYCSLLARDGETTTLTGLLLDERANKPVNDARLGYLEVLIFELRVKVVGEAKDGEGLLNLSKELVRIASTSDVKYVLRQTKRLADAIGKYDQNLGERTFSALCQAFANSPDKFRQNMPRVFAGEARFESLPGNELRFSGASVDGRDVDLIDYRGKTTLVLFTTSSCAPYLDELPTLREIYAKYRAAGFEIVEYNLEADVDALRKFVLTQKVPWTVVSQTLTARIDGENFVSPCAYYGIANLPTAILLDKNGKVVSARARRERLAEELAEIYPNVR